MIVALVFWLFLLGAMAISWQAGDRRDRLMVAAMILASVLTIAARQTFAYPASVIPVNLINTAMLVYALHYALKGRRYWPLWFVGVHGAGTLTGWTTILLDDAQHAWLLDMISGFWAIPSIVVMVWGLLLDQRAGVTNDPNARA